MEVPPYFRRDVRHVRRYDTYGPYFCTEYGSTVRSTDGVLQYEVAWSMHMKSRKIEALYVSTVDYSVRQ